MDLSKRSLIKHTCSWRDKPIVLWTLNRQAKKLHVYSTLTLHAWWRNLNLNIQERISLYHLEQVANYSLYCQKINRNGTQTTKMESNFSKHQKLKHQLANVWIRQFQNTPSSKKTCRFWIWIDWIGEEQKFWKIKSQIKTQLKEYIKKINQ